MYEFDKRLCALAGCPVIRDISGAMAFNPNPVVTAENDPVLAHEICHVLAGREDFEIFVTALQARDDDEIFRHVLNLLYDWYHESLYGRYSGLLYSKLTELHSAVSHQPTGVKALDDLEVGYLSRDHITKVLGEQGVAAEDAVDLIVIADVIIEKLLPNQVDFLDPTRADIMRLFGSRPYGKGRSNMGSPKSDIDRLEEVRQMYFEKEKKFDPDVQHIT